MTEANAVMLEKAKEASREILSHPVLSAYSDRISVVLKGSTARGYSDKYSDLDFVVFCDGDLYKEITNAYVLAGLSSRTDGVFLFHPEWPGHYNLDTYQHIEGYFKSGDIGQIWEYSNVVPISDPNGRYADILSRFMPHVFDNREEILKREYLSLQLNLDWMTMPLRRADKQSVLLYCAKVLRGICNLAFLLDGKCYPNDKWMFHYLPSTAFGQRYAEEIHSLYEASQRVEEITPDRDMSQYEQHRNAAVLVEYIIEALQREFPDRQWIREWYFYV